jgi:hypothetical protein
MQEFNLLGKNTIIKNSTNVTDQQYVQKYKKIKIKTCCLR